MAVPKKKTSYGRTSRRFKSFTGKVQNKLKKHVQIVECPDCKKPKLNHNVCEICGKYRGRQVIDMGKKMDKVTKIKA